MAAEIKIQRKDFRGLTGTRDQYQRLLPRAKMDINAAIKVIEPIINTVKTGSEIDLIELAEKFDGVKPLSIKVPAEIIKSAYDNLDPQVKSALKLAKKRIWRGHLDQLPKNIKTKVVPGGVVQHKFIPVDRVGLYVPGGRAVYPSSVLMNVIPAKIANVQSIAIASPPQKDNNGWPHPTILAAAYLLEIDEVYAIGGAQAVALFAFGMTGLIEKVDLVTGPGNIYVAAAKRFLRGEIAIDSEAGPTEIAVLADNSASAKDVAADLISQAEHDVIAAALLVTDSISLAEEVEKELSIRVNKTKHRERIQTALSGEQSAIVLVDNIKQGIDVVNAYAAEHLEIQCSDGEKVASKIRNAGAVFIGKYSPVSLGDYLAGSNHVLPTGGCACHSSGLSVNTFLKGVSFIHYNKKAFKSVVDEVICLANSEDLPAHGEAMSVRLENE